MVRLLPFASAGGPANMAADETLVLSAAAGVASLRFYGWTEATVSLGYFQPAAVRLSDARLAKLPWVRRPSGGATLVHHHEVTYCLALPRGAPWQTGEPWMVRMHRIVTAALADVGLNGRITPQGATAEKHDAVLCFHQHTPGDLLANARKVVGSAQRKYHQALLQHGSILLAQSEHTPSLPGIRELIGVRLTPAQVEEAVAAAFERETGWRLEPGAWTEAERTLARDLAAGKYSGAAWNGRR